MSFMAHIFSTCLTQGIGLGGLDADCNHYHDLQEENSRTMFGCHQNTYSNEILYKRMWEAPV